MNKRQQGTFGRFEGALKYVERWPIDERPPLLIQQHSELHECVTRIQQLDTDQKRAREYARGNVDARVTHLRYKYMFPLSRMARPLLAYAPGAEAALKVPHKRRDAATVGTAALRMAEFLTGHAELLESARVSPAFLDEFRAHAAALASITTSARDARQRGRGAGSQITRQLKAGATALVVIGGLVQLHRPDDLPAWKGLTSLAKPVGRPPKKRRRRPR